ncbi:MAG: hypothetical protein ABJB11_02905 [Ferruginibacter sp.]
MQQDEMKLLWQNQPTEQSNNDNLKKMLNENRHPVLKGIRRQLIFETIVWVFFLFVYYDIFDGDQKPFYANMLLIDAVVLLILHNIIGYIASKKQVNGINIKQSLENYHSKLKRYAIMSVATRVLAFGCLMLFFISQIKLDATRYMIIAGILMAVVFQVYFLSRIWQKRIMQIQTTLDGFN